MSRLHSLHSLITLFNNNKQVRKEKIYISNTSFNFLFIKILYVKSYLFYYSLISSNLILIFLFTKLSFNPFLHFRQISKPSIKLFADVSFLSFFFINCQVLSYSLIVLTNFGLFFLEEALSLCLGGLILCYLKQK